MRLAKLGMILAVAVLAGCGDSLMMACDEGPYQMASRSSRVQAPEGLDELDPLSEMPLPAASPQAPRADDAPCLEHPPRILDLN